MAGLPLHCSLTLRHFSMFDRVSYIVKLDFEGFMLPEWISCLYWYPA